MSDLKINTRTHVSSILLGAAIMFVLFSSLGYAATLVDYENGSLHSPSGGAFRYYHEGDSVLTLDTSQGMDGSQQSLHVNTINDNYHIWYIQNPDARNLVPEAHGADRMSFLIKIPSNYPMSSRGQTDNNFHLGTYTRDPEIPSTVQGVHYYHYFNIQGSAYPTKFIANQHPQHKVSTRVDVEDNPETWNYFDGFTRFYLELLPLTDSPIPLPFNAHTDEVKFYNVSEPENDETISSISCTYQRNGRFQIGWHGNSQYEPNGHRYEVRYSLEPITNANYSSATLVPGGPFSQLAGSYNFMQADFTINVQDNSRYYFAIKDIDSTIPYVSKIDYPLGEVTQGNQLPVANSGPDQQVTDTDDNALETVTLDGSASFDSDGTIEEYTWQENGIQIGTGVSPTVELGIGVHDIMLEVTDNEGGASQDQVSVTVVAMGGNSLLVSDVAALSATVNNVTINWATDRAANGKVEYGTDTNYGQESSVDTNLLTNHNIVLTELESDTTYHFRTISDDGSGNIGTSDDLTFRTLPGQATGYTTIWIETEEGTVSSPMQVEADQSASGGEYITIPQGTGDSSNPSAEALYNVDIHQAGDYYIWLSMQGPEGTSDALYIGPNGSFDRVYPPQWGSYEWVQVETAHNSGNYAHHLNTGLNRIAIGHGEELTRADRILITSSSSFIPGQEITLPAAPTGFQVIQ